MDKIIKRANYLDFLKLIEIISITGYPEKHKIEYDETTNTIYIESKDRIRQDIIDFFYNDGVKNADNQ